MKRAVGFSILLLSVVSCATSDVARESSDRTVVITMRDNHFEPGRLDVRRGETVAFRFVNRGRVQHDAFIGDEDAQRRHEQESAEGHGDGHTTGGAEAITVEPGDTGHLTHTFDERGEVQIGCHEPGHYDDGMVVEITVR